MISDEFKAQHNIISQTYLQPYIKGAVENAHYYFKNINNTKRFDLDNLLLTQGWSSYSWYSIFNHSPDLNYFFEKGITLKANVNNTEKSKYALHSVNSKRPNYYILAKNDKEFLATDLFPVTKETLKISKIEDKGKLVPAKLYPQFFPNTIPELNQEYALFDGNSNQEIETVIYKDAKIITTSLNKVQEVDEIVITAFGIKRSEKALGYSVQSIKGDAMTEARESNLTNAISGKIAGVQVTGTSGSVGASSRIVLRGNSSITGNKSGKLYCI